MYYDTLCPRSVGTFVLWIYYHNSQRDRSFDNRLFLHFVFQEKTETGNSNTYLIGVFFFTSISSPVLTIHVRGYQYKRVNFIFILLVIFKFYISFP